MPNKTHFERFKMCEDGFFGCLVDEDLEQVHVLIDNTPSAPLPSIAVGKTVILVKNDSSDESKLNHLLAMGRYRDGHESGLTPGGRFKNFCNE